MGNISWHDNKLYPAGRRAIDIIFLIGTLGMTYHYISADFRKKEEPFSGAIAEHPLTYSRPDRIKVVPEHIFDGGHINGIEGLGYDNEGKLTIDASVLVPVRYKGIGICRSMDFYRVTDYVVWAGGPDEVFSDDARIKGMPVISVADSRSDGYIHSNGDNTIDNITLGSRTFLPEHISPSALAVMSMLFSKHRPEYAGQQPAHK